MEITISRRADGMAEVRTSTGRYKLCTDEAQARVYAEGLADGYNAAVSRLGRCDGAPTA